MTRSSAAATPGRIPTARRGFTPTASAVRPRDKGGVQTPEAPGAGTGQVDGPVRRCCLSPGSPDPAPSRAAQAGRGIRRAGSALSQMIASTTASAGSCGLRRLGADHDGMAWAFDELLLQGRARNRLATSSSSCGLPSTTPAVGRRSAPRDPPGSSRPPGPRWPRRSVEPQRHTRRRAAAARPRWPSPRRRRPSPSQEGSPRRTDGRAPGRTGGEQGHPLLDQTDERKMAALSGRGGRHQDVHPGGEIGHEEALALAAPASRHPAPAPCGTTASTKMEPAPATSMSDSTQTSSGAPARRSGSTTCRHPLPRCRSARARGRRPAAAAVPPGWRLR